MQSRLAERFSADGTTRVSCQRSLQLTLELQQAREHGLEADGVQVHGLAGEQVHSSVLWRGGELKCLCFLIELDERHEGGVAVTILASVPSNAHWHANPSSSKV